MVYSFLATFDTIFHDFDVIHYHAIGPSVPLFLAKLFGKHTVCTVHGLNWRSDKWGGFASFYLRLGEKVAARFADEVIVLSEEEKQYFLQKYNRDSILIHNAVERITPVPCNVIREKYGLEKDSYILYVGRISPEKGPQDLLEAYQDRFGFYSCTVPTYMQYVLAELIENGDFERHINRVRRSKRRSLADGEA